MPLTDGPFTDRRPRASWRVWAGLIAAAAVSLALLGLSVRAGGGGLGGRISDAGGEIAAPAARAWAAPFGGLGAAGETIEAYLNAGAQNAALKRELRMMAGWRDTALALAHENARLRALARVRTDPPIPLVLARTVLESRGPFSRSRLIDVGADRGVAQGNPALSDHGLVGRVVGVSAHASRILLLTDPMSRTPVLLPRADGRAILAGDGGPNPALRFLRAHEPLRPGDRILTSGDGGVFPRGLAVGSLVRGLDGAWRVALDADAAPVDFVQVLLFTSFAQLAPAATPGPLPTTATEPPAPRAAPTAAKPDKPGSGVKDPPGAAARKPKGARP